jgi:hypothetical protein
VNAPLKPPIRFSGPPPARTGRDNVRGRGVLASGVLRSSALALGGAFDGRGQPFVDVRPNRPLPAAARTLAGVAHSGSAETADKNCGLTSLALLALFRFLARRCRRAGHDRPA